MHHTNSVQTSCVVPVSSELLFECYGVPSVAYCIDAPLAFYQNRRDTPPQARDGLVISFNTSSTSIVPVLEGKGILSNAKRYTFVNTLQAKRTGPEYTFLARLYRLPWGGSQASDYLGKLLSLKYPTFGTKITAQHTSVRLNTLVSLFRFAL